MSGYPDDQYDDRRDGADDRPAGGDDFDLDAARSRVKTVGTVLLVVSVINLIMVPVGVINFFTLPKVFDQQREQVNNNKDMPADQKQQMIDFFNGYEKVIMTALPFTLALQGLVGLLGTVGSVKMIRLRSRGWATTAAVVNLLPVGTFCCCLTLPVGIWGLIVLGKPDVRAAFEAAKSAPADGTD